jgi:hypothetical protein
MPATSAEKPARNATRLLTSAIEERLLGLEAVDGEGR